MRVAQRDHRKHSHEPNTPEDELFGDEFSRSRGSGRSGPCVSSRADLFNSYNLGSSLFVTKRVQRRTLLPGKWNVSKCPTPIHGTGVQCAVFTGKTDHPPAGSSRLVDSTRTGIRVADLL